MFRPTYHEPHDDRDWDPQETATTVDPVDNGLSPLHGLQEAIGTSEDFPLTTRPGEYLGIDRTPYQSPAPPPMLPTAPPPVTVTAWPPAGQDALGLFTEELVIVGPEHVVIEEIPGSAAERQPEPYVELPVGKHPFENLSGTAGCLAGSTSIVYLRGIRNGGRSTSLKDLYRRFNGLTIRVPFHDLTIPTFLHSLGDDGVMFYNKVVAVFESGIKPLVRVELYGETYLRATADHPIMTPNGFVPAGDLTPASTVLCRGGMLAQSNGGRDLSGRPPRVIVNTKYHPYGAYKLVEGQYEYMRVARARLVVEAALNNVPYDDFVHALKHNEAVSATFRYIPTDFEVHHDDENTLNDDLGNLVVLSKVEHARLHNQKGNFRFDSYKEVAVVNVTSVDEEMTYDVQMEAPANNFCANGIVVHNTGKTWMAKRLSKQSPKGSIIVAATTGIAAVNLADEDVETTTINAALKYFNTQDLQEKYTTGQLQAILRKHRRSGVRRIIIDEKSMMSGQQLTCIARAIDEVNTPRDRGLEAVGQGEDYDSGGVEEHPQMGITLVGDFGQLPPVPDDDPKTGKKLPIQFCFDSPEWARFAEHTTTLTKIWRQDDVDFCRGLHAVRKADIVTALAFFTPDKFADVTDDTFDGTTIFAKNEEVDRYNLLRMDRLQTPSISMTSTRKGQQRPDWKNIPAVLSVKEGALVMLLSNHRIYEDDEDSTGKIIYANGDLGTVLTQQENRGGWTVRLHRNKAVVTVCPIIRENTIPLEPGRKAELIALHGRQKALDEYITEDGRKEIIGTVFYMPMRLAYGCTVHKTQGLSLDNVQVNIRDPFFRTPGMLFVALSRARTIGGLRIVGNQRGFVERCRLEPRILPWL